MDETSFDDLARALSGPRPRRVMARALLGLAFGGAVAGGRFDAAEGKKRRKKRRKKRPPTDPCAGRPDDASCNGDGRCLEGRCNQRPACAPFSSTCSVDDPEACCSGVCFRFSDPPICTRSAPGRPCLGPDQCGSGVCVGYRCAPDPCPGQPNDTPCWADGRCLDGRCQRRPACQAAGSPCTAQTICCSGTCSRPDPLLDIQCARSNSGYFCLSNEDCQLGLACVGYRCQ